MEAKKPNNIKPKSSPEVVRKPVQNISNKPTVSSMPKMPTKPTVASAPKVNQPTAAVKSVEKPVSQTVNPISKPELVTSKTERKSKKGLNKKSILGIGIAVVVVIALIIFAIIMANQPKNNTEGGSDEEATTPYIETTTEEDDRITKETLDKYAEVTVDGYKKVDNNEISSDVVIVHVKNISEEQTSLAIAIVAEDNDGKVVDISYLYAEGIAPGETQEFQTFVYTKMTPDQMQNVKYKVYKANTYQAPVPSDTEETPPEAE